jgi:hypothetical protein
MANQPVEMPNSFRAMYYVKKKLSIPSLTAPAKRGDQTPEIQGNFPVFP